MKSSDSFLKRFATGFVIIVLLVACILFSSFFSKKAYESKAELLLSTRGKEPVGKVIIDAGCHAIKRAIVRGGISAGEVRYDAIKLDDVQLKSTGGGVWEVIGTCSPEQPKLPSRWKVVVNAVEKPDSLINVPAEIWTGENLDELVWTREKARIRETIWAKLAQMVSSVFQSSNCLNPRNSNSSDHIFGLVTYLGQIRVFVSVRAVACCGDDAGGAALGG
jgi:hypothetical protein